MNNLDSELYMQFKSERLQPAIDLVNRIDFAQPKSILDIGCGSGDSTQALINRWPKAQITGLDNSAAMIEKAARDYPNQKWILADVSEYEPAIQYDIVFANEAFEWLPNHSLLIKKLSGMLSDIGTLAVQIPLFWDMHLGKIINKTAQTKKWINYTKGIYHIFTIHNSSFYYDLLSDLFDPVEIWETQYFHILDSHLSMIKMMRSTALNPFLEKLNNDTEKFEFEKDVLKELEKAYPAKKNGAVLFPFKRLFFIGYKY